MTFSSLVPLPLEAIFEVGCVCVLLYKHCTSVCSLWTEVRSSIDMLEDEAEIVGDSAYSDSATVAAVCHRLVLVVDMISEMKLLMLVVGVATLMVRHAGDAFSTGPPSSACQTMMPSHGAESRTDQSPYVIAFRRRSEHSPGQSVDGKRYYP